MIATKKFTLGKKERLKSRKLIDGLFKEKKGFSLFPFRVFYMFLDSADAPLQAGFSASSRNFKKAVDRNRIRRLMKEAYRLQKPALQQTMALSNKHLILFFVYTGKEVPEQKEVHDKIGLTLQRLISIINEVSTA